MDYTTLNKEQAAAVRSDHNRILCLAGAGTGKTHTLINRIVRLYEDGTLPKNMLCLTFTKSAGQEMKERAMAKIGPQAQDLFCNTFHAFAAKILRRYAPLIGYTPFFSIYDEDDKKDIVQTILTTFQYKEKPKQVLEAMRAYYMYGVPPKGEMANIIKEYEYTLKRSNAFDFDGLLHNLKRLLCRADVQEYVRETYTHIFVDEFQDSDKRQMYILNLIDPHNLFVVGDDFQSIYSFSGADVSIIMGLAENPEWEVIKLEQNYRSSRQIVDAANKLIRHNNQTEKVLKTEKDGEEVVVRNCMKVAEPTLIDLDIRLTMMDSPELKYSDFAVLCRTNKQAAAMAEKIAESGTPVELVGSHIDKLFSQDAKGLFAWMSIVCNPKDDEAAKAALRYIGFNLSYRDMMNIELVQLTNDLSFIEASRKLELFSEFFEIYDAMTMDNLNAGELFGAISTRLTSEKGYMELGLESRMQIISDIRDTIEEWMKDAEEIGEPGTPDAWLEYYKLLRINGTMKEREPENAVQIMTAHKSKGLEWPTVYVTGCHQKSFPLSRGDLQEERRLFYVAMTRAKDRLLLTLPAFKENWKGNLESTEPSMFLSEI